VNKVRSAALTAGVMAALAVPCLAGGPGADDDATAARPAPAPASSHRYLWTTLESAAALAVGGVWYWSDVDFNQVDWELGWDWESWRRKVLSTDAIRFDTNPFSTNAVRHPFQGVVHYQIGRANGFGVAASALINLMAALTWEYLLEFPEYVSLNDVIVNASTGLSIGEPLVQIGRAGRGDHIGTTGRTLARSISPFDAMFGNGNGVGGRPWHHLELSGGAGSVRFGQGYIRDEGALTLDLDLVSQPGYGRPGIRSGGTAAGAWNRLTVDLRLASGEEDYSLFPGVRVHTSTTLAGDYHQDLRGDADGVLGSSSFIGLGTAFTYERRRLGSEWDRIGIAHLLGGRIELVRHFGTRSLRWELAGYGDFAMVQAHAFGPFTPFDDTPPLTSVLRAQGYYFAAGATGTTRLQLITGGGDVSVEVRAHQFWSIDGLDRQELGDSIADPHDVTDQRLFGRFAADLRPGGSRLGFGAVVDLALRRGAWHDLERRSYELGAGMRLLWCY